jgi:hypothetical protein
MSISLKRMGLASLIFLVWQSTLGSAQAQGFPGVGFGAPGGVNPYAAMGAGYGAGGVNPYAAIGGGYGANSQQPMIYYTGQGNGGIYGEAGGALYGAAQVINAYAGAINAQEQARITRELYYQAKIDTARKRFDLQRYIEANTPTFTEIEAKVQKNTLRRLQTNSTPTEITSGKALNILLDDTARFPGRKAIPEEHRTVLSSDVLRHLNVSSKEGTGLGILRDGGKINWPVALADILTPQQRKDMSLRAEKLVKEAATGRLDANVFKDLSNEIEVTRSKLLHKVNEMPGDQYRLAKRFLNDLEDSLRAVQDPRAVSAQASFDSWGAEKSRTVQDVVDYLANNGLRLAPATLGDEAAYRAFYSALSNLNIGLNSQIPPETKE